MDSVYADRVDKAALSQAWGEGHQADGIEKEKDPDEILGQAEEESY